MAQQFSNRSPPKTETQISTQSAFLTGLEQIGQPVGIVTKYSITGFTVRTLQGYTNEITISLPDGVTGNPVIRLTSTLDFTGKTITSGSYTSPSLITPALGTPTSGNLANCTGYPVSALTGFGTGVATWLSSPTSANLAAAVSNSSTGSGSLVFASGCTLIAPLLGTPASGILTNCSGTASGLTAGNVTTNANLTGPITSIGNATSIASQTGTGSKFVVDTSPTLITPLLGTPTSGILTNCTGYTTANLSGTITNSQLAGSISSSKLIGTDIATIGTITTGTWTGTTIAVANGGTGQTSYTDGQLLIGNTTGNTLTKATLSQGATAGVTITNGHGSITLDTTQDIRTSATPTFSSVIQSSPISVRCSIGSKKSAVTGDGTNYQIVWDTASENSGTILNTSTGLITFAAAGYYILSGVVDIDNISSAMTSAQLVVKATGGNQVLDYWNAGGLLPSGAELQVNISYIYKAAVNDTLYIQLNISGGTKSASVDTASYLNILKSA